MNEDVDRDARRNEVFGRLFDMNWAPVRHHLEWNVEDDAEVSELLSEVFLLAWQRLDPERPMGRIWLLRTADSRLRGRARRPRPRALDAVHEALTEGDLSSSTVCRSDVADAFAGLNARERRIIMLTYWDGLAAGEIAELLRRPRSRVQKILNRAQTKLRTKLGTEGVQHD